MTKEKIKIIQDNFNITPEEIKSISELKDKYLYSKLVNLDFKGLGRTKFKLAKKYNLDAMVIAFGNPFDKKTKTTIQIIDETGDIYSSNYYSFNKFLKECKETDSNEVLIALGSETWHNGDIERTVIDEIYWINKNIL